MKNQLQAYFNGDWVPAGQLAIPVDDLGFSMGVTIVERLRTFGGELFCTEKHLVRLRRSLQITGWDAEALCCEVENAWNGLLDRNRSLLAPGDDWSVVAFVTPGALASATKPTVCVHGLPLPFHHWAHQFETGIDTVFVETRQVPENCWPSELKCRSRMHYYLANREAERKQAGAQAILLDQDGYVGEGTTANVVAYFAERGFVTPFRSKTLPGVTQEVLYELAAALGIAHCEADLLPEQLAAADEIYFVSTSICLLPVVRLDGKPIGAGKPGPMYGQLLAAWSQHVGLDIAKQAQQYSTRI